MYNICTRAQTKEPGIERQHNAPMLGQSIVLNVSTDGDKGRRTAKKQSKGRRGRRMRGMVLRDMPISPSLKTSPKILKILVLGGYHPTNLIVPLLDKVMKSDILSFNIFPQGGLLPLNGAKGGLNFGIIMGGRLGGRSRDTMISRWGLMMRSGQS